MSGADAARSRAQMPPGTGGILDRRSLAGHPHLAALLRPGLKVLDVGCATGPTSSRCRLPPSSTS
jgi:2-polyprenyl-3-methyl-5-hydroxy-6-metoxy-1,4-benzoquinol methylase